MLWQLIQEAFEVDGRITQSLYLLFLKPGALSTAFSNNQRASFISPIRLYLFTSILFFFVAALEAPDIRNSDFTIDPPEEVTEIDSVSVTRFKETLDPKFHEHVDRIALGGIDFEDLGVAERRIFHVAQAVRTILRPDFSRVVSQPTLREN